VYRIGLAVMRTNYVIRLQKCNLLIGGLLCCIRAALSMSQDYNGLRIPSTLRTADPPKTNIAANTDLRTREHPNPQIGACRVRHSPPGRPPMNEAVTVNADTGQRSASALAIESPGFFEDNCCSQRCSFRSWCDWIRNVVCDVPVSEDGHGTPCPYTVAAAVPVH